MPNRNRTDRVWARRRKRRVPAQRACAGRVSDWTRWRVKRRSFELAHLPNWLVVRFVCVPLCVRVSRVSRVCPGYPRCLFTGDSVVSRSLGCVGGLGWL
jgi:hypothetical protein